MQISVETVKLMLSEDNLDYLHSDLCCSLEAFQEIRSFYGEIYFYCLGKAVAILRKDGRFFRISFT